MAENSYAQLIDDFENGINVLKGEQEGKKNAKSR